jgi:hypothetical protein
MLITATGDSIHGQGGKYLLSCSSKILKPFIYMLNAEGSQRNNLFSGSRPSAAQ